LRVRGGRLVLALASRLRGGEHGGDRECPGSYARSLHGALTLLQDWCGCKRRGGDHRAINAIDALAGDLVRIAYSYDTRGSAAETTWARETQDEMCLVGFYFVR
jgi:hypothetical protein